MKKILILTGIIAGFSISADAGKFNKVYGQISDNGKVYYQCGNIRLDSLKAGVGCCYDEISGNSAFMTRAECRGINGVFSEPEKKVIKDVKETNALQIK